MVAARAGIVTAMVSVLGVQSEGWIDRCHGRYIFRCGGRSLSQSLSALGTSQVSGIKALARRWLGKREAVP